MVSSLHAEGHNVSRLEKADILELTVKHLQKMKQQHEADAEEAQKFKDGFTYCASQVSDFVHKLPGSEVGGRLIHHLNSCIHNIQEPVQASPLDFSKDATPSQYKSVDENVWRPW